MLPFACAGNLMLPSYIWASNVERVPRNIDLIDIAFSNMNERVKNLESDTKKSG
jgi:hypothetical protein